MLIIKPKFLFLISFLIPFVGISNEWDCANKYINGNMNNELVKLILETCQEMDTEKTMSKKAAKCSLKELTKNHSIPVALVKVWYCESKYPK